MCWCEDEGCIGVNWYEAEEWSVLSGVGVRYR